MIAVVFHTPVGLVFVSVTDNDADTAARKAVAEAVRQAGVIGRRIDKQQMSVASLNDGSRAINADGRELWAINRGSRCNDKSATFS